MHIEITCNTDDEIIFDNIRENCQIEVEWVTQQNAHDGHAVIVGGGPSLNDSAILSSIEWRKNLGQTVFALNGAAHYLNEQGITPDYQVILDARPENIEFLANANEYLLASQCDPGLFYEVIGFVKSYRLWHPKITGIESILPTEKCSGLTLIGGGTTVGLSSICLAYTLGFRKFHLYGYDSSYRENQHHAYDQSINDAEQVVKVTVFGKTFISSLAMAKQAELFPELCNQLIDLGCLITVDGTGLLPYIMEQLRFQGQSEDSKSTCQQDDKKASQQAYLLTSHQDDKSTSQQDSKSTSQQNNKLSELEKYTRLWEMEQYRRMSPGEGLAEWAADLMDLKKTDIVIDFGCGTGRGGARLHEISGCTVFFVDFCKNALDEKVKKLGFEFFEQDLKIPFHFCAKYGYCTDVMEHLPFEDIEPVIKNMMASVEECFFSISLVQDQMGVLIQEKLHLSVFPYEWWKDCFCRLSFKIILSHCLGESAVFYIRR